jgi:adenine-specific DNA-methyltransferase
VGPERSLLVLCRAWLGSAEAWPNLSLKKLPNAVLGRCEFGRDDYSLRIASLPNASESAADSTLGSAADDVGGAASPAPARGTKGGRKRRGAQSDSQTDLLAEGDA